MTFTTPSCSQKDDVVPTQVRCEDLTSLRQEINAQIVGILYWTRSDLEEE